MLPMMEIDSDGAMRDIAGMINDYVNQGVAPGKYGFMVLVFPFGDDVRAAHYISNASREDMIKALREKADVLEKKLDISNCGIQQ